jgi:hypothetical protein
MRFVATRLAHARVNFVHHARARIVTRCRD